MRSLVLLVLLLALASLHGGSAAVADDVRPWNPVKQAYKKALKSKDAKERARAFEYLRDRTEPDAMLQLLVGVRTVETGAAKIKAAQAKSEKAYEKALSSLQAANAAFEAGNRQARDVEVFNKTVKKIEPKLKKHEQAVRALGNEWIANRALLDSATDVAASILTKLDGADLEGALAALRDQWLVAKDAANGPARWMEALGPVHRPAVTNALHAALADAELPQTARVAALQALAERKDGLALGKAMDMLHLPPAQFPIVTAAIGALRTMHDRRGIVPLMGFLKRQDLGRLRTDAHDALKSLTGEKHGPYYDPWATWWLDNERSFKMPADPVPDPTVVPQGKGMTFYGIHTFSDRVLFIVDMSGSMLWALDGRRGEDGGEKAKWVTAKKELIGAVNNLDDGANFNVILFNHEVLPWSPRVVTASSSSRKKLAGWVSDLVPVGLTNTHDALEAGFRLILQTTGRPDYDTVFFLTDGKPTSGKLVEPERILEAVREWNEVSNTQIHVIGIGGDEDIDESFLQALARIGGGKYVRHGG